MSNEASRPGGRSFCRRFLIGLAQAVLVLCPFFNLNSKWSPGALMFVTIAGFVLVFLVFVDMSRDFEGPSVVPANQGGQDVEDEDSDEDYTDDDEESDEAYSSGEESIEEHCDTEWEDESDEESGQGAHVVAAA